jgi:hypothetical protein
MPRPADKKAAKKLKGLKGIHVESNVDAERFVGDKVAIGARDAGAIGNSTAGIVCEAIVRRRDLDKRTRLPVVPSVLHGYSVF